MARSQRRSTPSCIKLPNLSQKFQSKYLIGNQKTRQRKFTPKNLFNTVLELVSSTNNEGYWHALLNSFGVKSLKTNDQKRKMPKKSSLSKKRARISYKFFQDLFNRLLHRIEPLRFTFRGLRIYGTDGFELTLPRTPSVLKAHYRGRQVSKNRQMFYPRMYLTHCYDVLTGTTKQLRHSHLLDEITDAEDMIPLLEKNSLSIYDRLYICVRLIRAHKKAKNFFLFRCRRSSFKVIQLFFCSPKLCSNIEIEGVLIHLIKIKNPKAKKIEDRVMVFATNLPRSWLNPTTINHLYALRWEVETSFRDLIQTMKIEQWHSKSINGILQELYAAFWLMNFTKIQIAIRLKKPKNPMNWVYSKPNFKLIFNYIATGLSKIFKRLRSFLDEIILLMNFSTEKRKTRSRAYPRQLRGSLSMYPYNNTVWNHDA